MRQKIRITLLALSIVLLTGCHVNHDCLAPISSDSISQNVYNDLQHEWDSWNNQENKMVSSHFPGYCRRGFDDWAECETFLGLSILNPAEECTWLEQATYVAMPIDFMDAQRIMASWYGMEDGHVEWISVQGGYRNGDIRVIINAMLYGDPADAKPLDSGWSVEIERQNYLDHVDDAQLQISSESANGYFSNTAYQAYGNILYRFQVIGNPDAQSQVENTLEQLVNIFSGSFI